MFALLLSYFINKVNQIAIECLDFAVGLHCLKNSLVTKIEVKDMEEKVELCGVILSSSYEMLLVIIKEFETESVIKGYHAYMNDWTPTLGENLSTCPEPENEIDKYDVAVTKDTQAIGHLKKRKTGRYTKTVFYFLRANPMNTGKRVTGKRVNFGDRQGLQIPCTILFKGEEKYTEVLKKQLNLYPL